ncbi:sugar nucleotide-binding protein [Rhodococcus erythropolis]|uniref:sugar nucleotide-binding protein n=1 Tax=Rhodococcus erythropolis TaxID=1833 RepID=UPI0021092741|nr:sugar nucleotide-binding protein [Rhodococcus erythropolis]MCQ4127767.1 sugar nucleotide-binding protein [Rhodococcus erythropolis]
MTKVLVLGGYGAVGIPLMKQLAKVPEISAYSAGRDRARADVVVDLKEPGAYSAAVRDFDVVVNASGFEEVRLAEEAVRGGRHSSTSRRPRATAKNWKRSTAQF